MLYNSHIFLKNIQSAPQSCCKIEGKELILSLAENMVFILKLNDKQKSQMLAIKSVK